MSEKGKQILSYIFGWVGGLIVLFGVKNNTKKTNFHAAQAIVASGGYFVIIIIYNALPIYIPLLSTALYVFYIVIMVMGIVKAAQEAQNAELPLVGNIAKKLFEKQINTGLDEEVNTNNAGANNYANQGYNQNPGYTNQAPVNNVQTGFDSNMNAAPVNNPTPVAPAAPVENPNPGFVSASPVAPVEQPMPNPEPVQPPLNTVSPQVVDFTSNSSASDGNINNTNM